MEQMSIAKFKMLIDGEKLFADLEKKTSYKEYCDYKMDFDGTCPTIIDYIIHLEEENKENKELKEKLEFTNKVKEDYFNTIKWKNDMIVNLEEENEKLKEKLNQSITP